MNKNAKKGREKDYFWVSLMPGLAALAVFAAAIFFLFYHVEPSSTAVDSLPPISPISPTKPGPDNPVRADDIPVAEHGLTVELFWIGLSPMNMAMLLFVSALAAGFVIFVMAKYRDEGVRALEQGWN